MAVVNRVAKGLLGILDAKTGGQLPSGLSGELTGGIEMLDLYLADIPLEGEDVAGFLGSGDLFVFSNPVTVPNGELWAVKSVSTTVVASSGSADWEALPAVEIVSRGALFNFQFLASFQGTNNSFAIGEGNVQQRWFERPFFATAGTRFGSVPIRSFPGNAATTTQVVFHRISI